MVKVCEISNPGESLAFAQFKSNQGLSHKEICDLFGCSLEESKAWSSGYAPSYVNEVAILGNSILEKAKLKSMSDVDRQHFEHRAELLEKENEALKAENENLKGMLSGASESILKALEWTE